MEALGVAADALDAYLAALNMDPDFAAAHYNAARLYSQTGDLELCVRHLERAIRLAPQFRAEAETDDNLGWVMKLHGLRRQRRGPERDAKG